MPHPKLPRIKSAADGTTMRTVPAQLVDDDGNAVLLDAMFRTPLGYARLSAADLDSSTGLDVPEGAAAALVQANGGTGVRWRDDGEDPTAMLGMRLSAGDERTFMGGLEDLRFIDEGANAVLDIAFYG